MPIEDLEDESETATPTKIVADVDKKAATLQR